MAPPARSVSLLAPAKLNLALRVVGRRSDGYHELDAPTVPIGLCDQVTVALRPDRRIVNDWRLPGVPVRDELGWRAARLLAAETAPARGAAIRIAKHIPAGAGLGGGSSDAAAVLLACNRLWGTRWSRARLAALGLRLGADVPFFIHCRQARLRGRGELLAPLRRPAAGWAAVAVPAAGVSTAAAFAAHAAGRAGKHKISGLVDVANDLGPVAQMLCPEITKLLRLLRRLAGQARLSGSGSACFAVLPGRRQAVAVAQALAAQGYAAWAARIMRGRPLSLGSSQAVRQRVLVPSCVGSNPTSPAL